MQQCKHIGLQKGGERRVRHARRIRRGRVPARSLRHSPRKQVWLEPRRSMWHQVPQRHELGKVQVVRHLQLTDYGAGTTAPAFFYGVDPTGMLTARLKPALSKPSVLNNFLHGGDAEPPLRPTPCSNPIAHEQSRPKAACSCVDSSYKTSNRLKSYLSRFWDYCQTSPALQSALANAI